MYSLYWGNGKIWAEMTPTEQKTFLIILGVMAVGLACYGIYYYFKNKKE